MFTLSMCSLLKIENNSSWVSSAHFREKMHFLALELIFVSSSWRFYMYIKLHIQNKRLKWYKKRSVISKWAIQNNSDALAAKKWSEKIKTTQIVLILTHSLWQNVPPQVELLSDLFFKRVYVCIYSKNSST